MKVKGFIIVTVGLAFAAFGYGVRSAGINKDLSKPELKKAGLNLALLGLAVAAAGAALKK